MGLSKSELQKIEQSLSNFLSDSKLAPTEKNELREIACGLNQESLNFLRNRAFEIARQQILSQKDSQDPMRTLSWLEKVVKLMDQSKQSNNVIQSAHFSPGIACRDKLIELCHEADQSIDICVFTISDDRLSSAIINAANRGIGVRIVTDNDKSYDLGSDIERLAHQGIPTVMDTSPHHMHHKFAIFDGHCLANGSFNWTRSATKNNEENIVVSNEGSLVKKFQEKFEELWISYS